MNLYKATELLTAQGKGRKVYQFSRITSFGVLPVGYCALRKCLHWSPEEACDCYRRFCKTEQDGVLLGLYPIGDDHWGELLEFEAPY